MMDLYGGKVWYEDNDPHGAVAILEFQRAGEAADTEAGEIGVTESGHGSAK